jgi:hypothetical protein
MGNPGLPILFFDGECGVCTRTVRFLLHRDRRRRSLRFASLQGNTARELLRSHPGLAGVDSLIWFDPPDATWGREEDFGGGGGSVSEDAGPVGVSGRVQVRSDAVIMAGRYLGGSGPSWPASRRSFPGPSVIGPTTCSPGFEGRSPDFAPRADFPRRRRPPASSGDSRLPRRVSHFPPGPLVVTSEAAADALTESP